MGLVMGWLGLSLKNTQLQQQIATAKAEQTRWQADAVRYAGTVQARARLLQQLEVLRALPPGYTGMEEFADGLAAALPDGARLLTANVADGGFVLITGTATDYESVERFARALEAGGMFRYVRVATAGQSEASGGSSEMESGPVTFQVEGWLGEAAGHGGGI
ncbi:PilN domain-containing protein [Thermaerobacter litoralis]